MESIKGYCLMAGYREKQCPHCGTLHKKRGPYCCRSCGNHRVFSQKERMEKSKKQTEFLKSDSPVAEQSRWIISEMGKFASKARAEPAMKEKNWDDYNVIPERQLPNNQFVADDAIWETKD